jgi:hypothetical protein
VWKRITFVILVPAATGAVVGFFALAFAVQNEPGLSAVLVSILSPGLKVAEFLTPVKRQSLGSTFGGFLRVAIAINAVFYFVIFAFAAALARRLARRGGR